MTEVPASAPPQTRASTPAEVETAFRELPLGRMRSRAVGARRDGVLEVVLVMGMAVSDYLLPGWPRSALGHGSSGTQGAAHAAAPAWVRSPAVGSASSTAVTR
jgi:hypothetical protein